ncbi:hypothetical protein THAOC_23004 [Thalassiosira oceanica]|uniref:Uncharacterized protein n=1 Tax=Thalassiosira oceanica TaxID=159749 RepID=K0RVH5_THAOC|nr:hypothetical protein THAOC_23004 [Thalassiosira oceanica]|eukprot:EJK57000.1 hypothetical protein THAOC_23004 [Thalassiosira oceanica]
MRALSLSARFFPECRTLTSVADGTRRETSNPVLASTNSPDFVNYDLAADAVNPYPRATTAASEPSKVLPTARDSGTARHPVTRAGDCPRCAPSVSGRRGIYSCGSTIYRTRSLRSSEGWPSTLCERGPAPSAVRRPSFGQGQDGEEESGTAGC